MVKDNHKYSQDENTKDENFISNVEQKQDDIYMENSDNDYTFVQERILTSHSRRFRLLSRVFWNIFIPISAGVTVCLIFYLNLMDEEPVVPKETGTENGILINDETDTSDVETTTSIGDKENSEHSNNPGSEENLVKLEETIKKMIVVVSVVRDKEENTENRAINGKEESSKPSDKDISTSDEYGVGILSEGLENIYDGKQVEKYTGVVVSMYGPVYVLLQYENIKDYKELYVHIGDSIILETTVYDVDYVTGLALLKIEKSKVTEEVRNAISVAAFRNENKTIEGTDIVYCGNVVGKGPMFMKGHISNSSNDVSCIDLNYNMLITDIMFENAKDGFLFNGKGNLVGIVGLAVDKLQLVLPSVVAGASAMDLTYIINNMLNEKKDIYFGITGQEVSAKIEEIAGGSMPRGIYVSSVRIDSPAYNAGIMPGDIIYMIDKINEPDMVNFSKCIQTKAKGDTVKVGVKRKIGNEYNVYTMKVILDNRD